MMVYHGALSKGCERCRKRKVKCDQQKPACFKCAKSGLTCPGYRNLNEVMFRDENPRIVRKARRREQLQLDFVQDAMVTTPATCCRTTKPALTTCPPMYNLLRQLAHPNDQLGASFFFANYTFNEVPFAGDYHDWLTQSYTQENHVLRAAIEAVGLAGVSNVSYAPDVERKAKEWYSKALTSLNAALGNPVEAVTDATLMGVILLGLFETVNFESHDRYDYWAAHVKGALTLLELRGQNQFSEKRGGLLYVLVRSQILLACMQQHTTVPLALVQATHDFQNSAIRQQWARKNVAGPRSICEIAFRIINLGATFSNGQAADHSAIHTTALDIDADLRAWLAGLPTGMTYHTLEASDATAGALFDGKRHIYRSLWVAEAWNNWRALRIVIIQIILQNDLHTNVLDDTQKASYLSSIHQLSTDICISTSAFSGTSRILSLIRPLYMVSQEQTNPLSQRVFALEKLRNIGTTMGIRQAGLLADTISKGLAFPQNTTSEVQDEIGVSGTKRLSAAFWSSPFPCYNSLAFANATHMMSRVWDHRVSRDAAKGRNSKDIQNERGQ